VLLAFAHALYALFYFALAGQVFIELACVGGAYTPGKILGAVFYAVENADVLQAATVVKAGKYGDMIPGCREKEFVIV
jgi:hypothetical protein